MDKSIFLSASIPDARRGEQFAESADTVAIAAAVSALVNVTLGRRILVWGGHPAITPMIWAIAEAIDVDYGSWVQLYQSRYFRDEYPEDNERFRNITYTEDIQHDFEKSLHAMRKRMLSERAYSAAVFIGGRVGVVEEFSMLRAYQPDAKLLPVVTTGGAALQIAKDVPSLSEDFATDYDYVAVFHRHLGISPKERRYRKPEDQPADVRNRLWSPE